MGNWNGKDAFGIADDLAKIHDDVQNKIKDLKSEVAKMKDENEHKKSLQKKINQLAENYEKDGRDLNEIAKDRKNSNVYKDIKGDTRGQGKCSPKGTSAKNKKVVAIQLYCAQKTDITDYVMRELEKKLTSEQFHKDMKLTVKKYKTLSEILSDKPLIAICLNCSRLGVDFSDAISGIPDPSNTAVLIFHLMEEYALPTQSSNIVLTKDDVTNVGTIIDVAFFDKIGLYDCEMNERAHNELVTFIEKFP